MGSLELKTDLMKQYKLETQVNLGFNQQMGFVLKKLALDQQTHQDLLNSGKFPLQST